MKECLTHIDALHRAALRMTREADAAADLVQETYLKATRSVDSYTEGSGTRAWLFRILTNAYIDRYREQARSPQIVELTDEAGLYELFLETRAAEGYAPVPWSDEELEEFLRKFVGDEVKGALESLPPAFRLVVLLRDVEGFSYREIAEITGVPVGTVMSRLFRGRKGLQERLTTYARSHGYAGPSKPA